MGHPEPEVGVGMAPSRVRGWARPGSRGGPVQGSFLGVLGGVSGRFFVGVSAGCFSAIVRFFFLSVSAVEAQHPKLSPRQLNVPCAAST